MQDMENEPVNEAVRPPSPDNADDGSAAAQPTRGTIRSQEPGITRVRPATVAEARARDKARKAREVADQFAAEQAANAQRRRDQNKKTLMGAVAVVGVVAVVALGYQVSKSGDRDVTATCVDENSVVVPDSYCGSGTAGMGGVFIFAGAPYRYYYGGTTGGVGTRAAGGTLTQPSGTTAKTKAGSSISRGGFGSSSVGSSGG
jgi:type II secretory pathway pseudopilin PulG